MTQRYTIDEHTHAPIVVLTIYGDTDRSMFGALLREYTQMLKSWSEPRFIVFDATKVTSFKPDLRRMLASWRASNKDLLRDKIRAGAYIMTSPVVRGYLTAVNWLRPTRGVVTTKVFSSFDDAAAWFEEISSDPF